MPPKRRADSTASSDEGEAPAKRRAGAPSSTAGSDQRGTTPKIKVRSAKVKAAAKAKAKTMKDRTLFVLAYSKAPVDLPTLKECLIEEFGLMKAFNKNLTKALALLGSSPRADFVTDGETYHGGEARAAVQDAEDADEGVAVEENADADDEDEEFLLEMEENGFIKCCFCRHWCEPDCALSAKGSNYRCGSCDKIFWTWGSDGHSLAHEISYTKSKQQQSR